MLCHDDYCPRCWIWPLLRSSESASKITSVLVSHTEHYFWEPTKKITSWDKNNRNSKIPSHIFEWQRTRICFKSHRVLDSSQASLLSQSCCKKQAIVFLIWTEFHEHFLWYKRTCRSNRSHKRSHKKTNNDEWILKNDIGVMINWHSLQLTLMEIMTIYQPSDYSNEILMR